MGFFTGSVFWVGDLLLKQSEAHNISPQSWSPLHSLFSFSLQSHIVIPSELQTEDTVFFPHKPSATDLMDQIHRHAWTHYWACIPNYLEGKTAVVQHWSAFIDGGCCHENEIIVPFSKIEDDVFTQLCSWVCNSTDKYSTVASCYTRYQY